MLAETVREAARRFGMRAALVDEGEWALSYAELDRVSDELAVGLARRGIGVGDIVALVLPPVAEHIVAYVALAKVGAITAAVNSRLTVPERAAMLSVARPALCIATTDLAPDSMPDGGSVEVVEEADSCESLFPALRMRDAVPTTLSPDPKRPIALVFTSGTTGIPKGALYSGHQLSFITETDVGPEWGGGDDVLAGSVLSHLGPMTKLAGSLRRGNTQHLCRRWRAGDALRRTQDLHIRTVAGVPAQIALMLGTPDFDDYDLSRVGAVLMGGGPATPSLVRDARERFGASVMVRYSCTEAGIGTGTGLADPDEDAEVSVGRPQPGVKLDVLGDSGEPVNRGEIGEVCLASPATMDGYWQDPEATKAAFTETGAVRTGDLGFVDGEGRLHLVGRTREMYVRGGYNVYPMEVEAALSGHPGVAEVAVVARPDPVMGEVGVAVVVARPDRGAPTLETLRAFGGDKLARYKLPDEVRCLDALPLTAMDKVDRRALEAMVASRDLSAVARESGLR